MTYPKEINVLISIFSILLGSWFLYNNILEPLFFGRKISTVNGELVSFSCSGGQSTNAYFVVLSDGKHIKLWRGATLCRKYETGPGVRSQLGDKISAMVNEDNGILDLEIGGHRYVKYENVRRRQIYGGLLFSIMFIFHGIWMYRHRDRNYIFKRNAEK